jgi:CubicO group peptidase (beta-lactamase class C family)
VACWLLLAIAIAGCGADGDDGSEEAAPTSMAVEAPVTSPEEATRALFAGIADDEPGCTVAVAIDDEVAFAEAYGGAALDPLVPFTTDTVVDIASTSKQFTAMAAGLLILDGDLATDDLLADVVPNLPAWSDEVTIEQLLNHTSGIPDYIELLADAGVEDDQPASQQDALDALAEVELDAEPGEVFAYSNSNYLLLAEVVAAVDGRDLPTFLDEEVFEPLDVDAAMSFPSPSPELAMSYVWDDEWVEADSAWTQVGDGAVRTTPGELARFGSTYWRTDGPWADLAEIRDEIGVEGDDGTYSLGIEEIDLDGRQAFSHDGAWSGFETSFIAVPDDRTTVALTCNSPDVEVADDVEQQVLGIWTA